MVRRTTHWLMVGALLWGALLLRAADPAPLAQMRALAFDALQRMRPRTYDPALPVRVVDIDDESLRRYGQWPWPRSLMATLTERISAHKPVVVAFDIVFPEAERQSFADVAARFPGTMRLDDLKSDTLATRSGDLAFAAALSDARAILGLVGNDTASRSDTPPAPVATTTRGDPRKAVPGFAGMTHAHRSLLVAGTSVAALNWLPEQDQVARRVPLVVAIGGNLYPTLATEAVRLGQGATDLHVTADGVYGAITTVKTGNVYAPTDARGQLWLHFTVSDPRRSVPAWKVLTQHPDAQILTDRIVLVGTSASGLYDLRTTPLEAAVPGVEIQAQAIEQLASGAYLQRPDFSLGLELLYTVAVGLGLAFLVRTAGAVKAAIVGAVAVLLALAVTWFAFTRGGFLLDPVYPIATATLIYLATTARQAFVAETERNSVRAAFSRYMAPALVEELARDPSRLKLGGEMKPVTLLFCDIRGFTTLSEKLGAVEVTNFLNALLTPLSNAVLATGGTIDKYLGDGIMAFWNAPLDDIDHAASAARSALAMITAVDTFNRDNGGARFGIDPAHLPVRIGIGLNTALCCVGNLGSETRFDYSVIGDGVNMAARIEQLTKSYGTSILAGADTVAAAPEFAWLEVDSVQLRGRNERVAIHALVGDAAMRASPAFAAISIAHRQLIDMIAAGDSRAIAASFAAASKAAGPDLAPFYREFEQRLPALRAIEEVD